MTSGEESISRTTSDKLIAEKDEMSVDIRAFSGDHERETEFQLRTKPLPRRRLVGPVFLILFVSFASIIGFLWLSTRGLNEDALLRDSVLVDSLLEVETSTLNRLAEIGARNYSKLLSALETRNMARAERELSRMSREMSGLSQIWFVAKDGKILLGEKEGASLNRPRDESFARQLSDLTLQATLPAANQARSFLRDGDSLYLAVARGFSSFSSGANLDPENYIVLLRRLDSEFFELPAFRRSGLAKISAGMEMGPDYSSLPLRAPDGSIVGYVFWIPNQPGDLLIWPLSPAFALGLIAIGYFLFLFVRRADLFVERQAYLAAALQQEQNVRDLKMRFVSMISHELRTPLASIRSAAELMERYGDRMTELDKEEELKVIHRSVDTLVRLIDNVVLVGKSDWLGNPGTKASIDLVEFCQQVWDEANYGATSHRLLINEEGRRRPLQVDTSYLRALLSNLLQNAIKYSPGRREVMVTVFYRQREVVVRITDFGIGIPEEDLRNIFDPFMRGRNAESFAGSGLGLAIAKASAEAIGGTIGVSSKTGGGTTFEITFPLGRQAIKS